VKIAIVDPLGYTTPYDDRLASALGDRGHDVHFLTAPFLLDRPPDPRGYVREEIFVPHASRLLRRAPRARVRKALKALEYLPSVRRLLRRLDALDPDVVHVQWLVRPELDVHWMRRLARKHATALTAHNALPRRQRAFGAWREVLGVVGRVVVTSGHAVELLVDFGAPREKIVHIPHPVFEASVDQTVTPPSGHTLLFFGLIRHHKGLDVLVRALVEIRRAVPDVRLVVAGDPLEPIGPVRELATELGVDAAIDWRLGFVPDAEVPALVESAAILVLPYRSIVYSGVLSLALGCARPVVVSDLGAVGDTVRDFGAGRAVPAEDVDALAAACVELLSDEVALAKAHEGALEARSVLTWANAAEQHERLYEALAARTSTPAVVA
jgi:glycosyltransferase involved in cell wall biosynthesis